MTNDARYTFTVVDPETEEETQVSLVATPYGYNVAGVSLDNQQLMELGVLLIALAGQEVDYNSAFEVLDGFGLADAFLESVNNIIRRMS